jgi:hypothetical protein
MAIGEANMKAKTFRVRIEDRNGLFVATSPDLKGMLVVRDSAEELIDAIPIEVADLYAVCGVEVVVTELDDGDGELRPWVAVSAEVARRALQVV